MQGVRESILPSPPLTRECDGTTVGRMDPVLEIALRLVGAVIGLNRDLHGKPTGVRTMGLVSQPRFGIDRCCGRSCRRQWRCNPRLLERGSRKRPKPSTMREPSIHPKYHLRCSSNGLKVLPIHAASKTRRGTTAFLRSLSTRTETEVSLDPSKTQARQPVCSSKPAREVADTSRFEQLR